jgi:hypothetical protein
VNNNKVSIYDYKIAKKPICANMEINTSKYRIRKNQDIAKQ